MTKEIMLLKEILRETIIWKLPFLAFDIDYLFPTFEHIPETS